MIGIDKEVLEMLKQIQNKFDKLEEKQENIKNVVKQNCNDIADIESVIKRIK